MKRLMKDDEDIVVWWTTHIECLSALSRRQDAAEAFSLIWNFDLEVFSLGLDEFLEGITLSRQYGITLYDAAYVVLARKLGCPFVTSDRSLYKKLKGLGELRIG